jgi:hypothetical protein
MSKKSRLFLQESVMSYLDNIEKKHIKASESWVAKHKEIVAKMKKAYLDLHTLSNDAWHNLPSERKNGNPTNEKIAAALLEIRPLIFEIEDLAK